MDSATEDIYLQKLEEFVYDEEKVVTSRWLSFNLNITIQDSKHLLEKYVSDAAGTGNKQVTITHLLSGISSDGNLHISIAKDSELDEKKSAFRKVVDQQIYSIQRCKELDLNILGMVDYFEIHNPKDKPVKGSITSKQCVQRIIKSKKLNQVSSAIKPLIQTKPIVEKPAQANSTSSAKQAKGKIKQSNGITSFFNKNIAPTKPKSEPGPSTSNELITKPQPTIEKITGSNRLIGVVDSESDNEDVKPQSIQKSYEKKKVSSKKRTKKTNGKAPSPKRRRRIVEHDSDSDDMFGSDTKEDNMETIVDHSDEEEIPKPKPTLAPKNKKKKLVDRTYEDAEGYVITTKEWMEESPSEDEVIPETPQKEVNKEPKQEIMKEPKKKELQTEQKLNSKDKKFTKSESSDLSDTNNKDTKPTNGKIKGGKKGNKPLAANQPTLMNFFKRV